MKRKLLVGGTLLAMGLVFLGWRSYMNYLERPTVLEGPNLKFSVAPCDQPSPYGPGPKQGVLSTWRGEDGIIRVEALMIENCAATISRGGYALHGDTIYLAYRVGDPLIPAACNCARRLHYEITNFPPHDYKFRFPTTSKRLP